jgi:hypothetical protein
MLAIRVLNLTRGVCLLLLALLALTITTRPACAAGGLGEDLARVAEAIDQYLKDKGLGDRIAVGAFTASTAIPASAGPAIQKTLADELAKRKLRVDPKARVEVKGDYLKVEDPGSERLSVLVKARLLDRRKGDELVVFSQQVLGDAVIASLLGLDVALSPKGDNEVRDGQLRKSIENPKVALAETRVSAGPKSPYGIEVLVKKDGRYVARTPEEKGGLAFVPIRRDEVYAVHVINDSPYDAAVSLTVDGLNMFTFSENPAYRNLGKVLVPPNGATLYGWHLTDQQTSLFQVTSYANSAEAAVLRSGVTVGTITATFAAAWQEDAAPPPDEPTGRAAVDATGRGPITEVHYESAQRRFGVVRAAVSVRYTKE